MTEERIQVPKGEGDNIETPPWLFSYLNETFRFTWDACSNAENNLVGGFKDALLMDNWLEHRTVFMNPPYSKPKNFLLMAAEASKRNVTTVALIKGDPSTTWWNSYVDPYATVKWLPYRIRFYYKGKPTQDVANFPSVIAIYWGVNWKR